MARRLLAGGMAIKRRAGLVAASALGVLLVLESSAHAKSPGGNPPGWERQADQALGGGRGIGRRLMTEEEWQTHHEQMRTLQGEEREKARQAWHDQMLQRAKERGVTLPATPGPHRGGPGGMGRGGGPPRE